MVDFGLEKNNSKQKVAAALANANQASKVIKGKAVQTYLSTKLRQ